MTTSGLGIRCLAAAFLVEIDDFEALEVSGRIETLVEADDLEGTRVTFGSQEGSRELQGIGGAQVVNAEEPLGGFADHFARLHFVPACR